MSRSIGIAGVLAVLLMLGSTSEAHSQERATLAGAASCIDGEGKYVITWTLNLSLGPQESANAQTPISETDFFDGLDLIGQPQHEGYPFQAEAGNIFTAANGALVNGANTALTPMDIGVYDPASITAAGNVITSEASTAVEATVTRPAACTA